MEYKDFKNGDVIVFKICSGNEMIAIFNKIETFYEYFKNNETV